MPLLFQVAIALTAGAVLAYTMFEVEHRCAHVWEQVKVGEQRCSLCRAVRLVDEPLCVRCVHDRFNHVAHEGRVPCAVVGCPCGNYTPRVEP